MGFPCGSAGEESACNSGSTPGLEDPLEKGKAIHSSVWPGKFHGHSPWGRKESDTTEWLSLSLFTVRKQIFTKNNKTNISSITVAYKCESENEFSIYSRCCRVLQNQQYSECTLFRITWTYPENTELFNSSVCVYIHMSAEELMLLNCGVGEDSWESLGLQGDPTSPF